MVRTAENPAEAVLTPASQAKRDAIVEAAVRLFLAHGFGAVSMDQIAAGAGVSKQTVYSHFGAKDGLFEEIVKDCCGKVTDGDAWLGRVEGEPEEVLFNVAKRFLYVLMGDDNITLFRILIAENGRFPELAEAFYRSGPRRATVMLAGYLEQCHADARLRIDDSRAAAELFFAMLRGDIYMRRLLALRETPSEQELEGKARNVAKVFVTAYAAK